jgi:hypothetical protein
VNSALDTIIAAGDDERRDLFTGAAGRLGTAVQNVEKDFWVCWILDVLFNRLPDDRPRLLFKGGTSLSKAFGLITRFSEDIDVTVFREDLGTAATVDELEALSGKKQRARLTAIKAARLAYIAGSLLDDLSRLSASAMKESKVAGDRWRLELDKDDPDQQTLLFWYPAVTAPLGDYIRSAIKIESGAKSALDPHVAAEVKPYVADDLDNLDLTVKGVTTVEAARTFWDKITILHGLRRWYDKRGTLRHGEQRVSRHYYDVDRLLASPIADPTLDDADLGLDCARHARMFFNSSDLDLAHAAPGSFTIAPSKEMIDPLRRDTGRWQAWCSAASRTSTPCWSTSQSNSSPRDSLRPMAIASAPTALTITVRQALDLLYDIT